MTERERVMCAVSHKTPDRCPVFMGRVDDIDVWHKAFGVNTGDELRALLQCDLRKVDYTGARFTEPGKTVWGSSDNYDAGYGSPRGGFPLQGVSTVKEVEAYRWPEPDVFDYELLSARAKAVESKFARILTVGFLPPFNTLMDLFGMEDALVMLYEAPGVTEAALAHIEHFVLESMKRLLDLSAVDADFFWLGDDFSTQRGMMLSPACWRRYLKPLYKKFFELVKGYNLKVWFHSCGTFEPVRTDLLDIGIDVWETVQAHLEGNEPEKLKSEFGKHVTFFGGINCQQTLPFGTPEDVRREVRERIRVLGKDGGYICGPDHSIQGNMPPENIFALYDEARKFVP